jgi:hypothetical protein
MKKRFPALPLTMSIVGLLVGYFANRSGPNPSTFEEAKTASERTIHRVYERVPNADVAVTELPKIHSSETLETLRAQGENATYADLALWMLDATAADIAAYWDFRKNGNFDGDRKRLLFINWTRLDPQAAINAVAGTGDASIPWWSWASHDPEAALSAAGSDRLDDVVRGIGEFHPKWLRENFERIPESARSSALSGLTTWKEDSDPIATMDFLKKHGAGVRPTLLRTLALKDPWAAFEWLKKDGPFKSNNGTTWVALLDTLKSESPEDLRRMAEMTPPGALKWKMEDTLFSHLLATDPEAALEQAKSTDAPLVAAKRLAEIGNSLLGSDPEKAFEIGADILAACPDRLNPQTQIQTDTYATSWGGQDNTTTNFMNSLLLKDPGRTLEMITAEKGKIPLTFHDLSGKWAERDLKSYAEWVNQQTDPAIWNAGANQVVNKLSSQGNFQEAAEWAMGGEDKNRSNLHSLAWRWSRSNPNQALEWVETTPLPEPVKNSLRNTIQQNR